MKKLSKKQVQDIKDNFEYFDSDGNGLVDLKEFTGLLKIISPNSTSSQATEGFAIVDSNEDGFIDFVEFLDWWQTVWWEF